MGLKMSVVIIEGRPKCTVPELIESFGFKNVLFNREDIFGNDLYPGKGIVAVSPGKNYTVIAHDTLPVSIINPDFSDKQYFYEITLRRYFETGNMMAVLLHSVTNTYGMSMQKNGSYSFLYGSSGGLHRSKGRKTKIELDYLENSFTNEEGQTIFRVDGDEYTTDQLGENMVLWNVEDFTGLPSGTLAGWPTQVFTVSDEHLKRNN